MLKNLDFLTEAETGVRAMTLSATSLPQGCTIGERKEQSTAHETRAKGNVQAFFQNQQYVIICRLPQVCSEAVSSFPS